MASLWLLSERARGMREFGNKKRNTSWTGAGAFVLAALTLVVVYAPFSRAAPPASCPVNTGDDFYVDPTLGSAKKSGPTGVASPSSCSFATITQAIQAIQARGTGTARIVLAGGTSSTPAVLSKEQFPLVLPPDTSITTTDDPALGGAGLAPGNFVVSFVGRATHALSFNGGNLAGFTIENRSGGKSTADSMVVCSGGTTRMDWVTLDGRADSAGRITQGLQLASGCDLTVAFARVRGMSGNGVLVDVGATLTAEGTTCDSVFGGCIGRGIKVHDNGGDGIVIRGTANLLHGVIALNGDDGILVESAPSATFVDLIVRDNGGNGFEIHTAVLTALQNLIYNNSRSTGWDQPQVLFDGAGNFTFGDPPLDVFCGLSNAIFGYDPTAISAGAVGMRAVHGAQVDARYNRWVSTPKISVGVTSSIQADPYCLGVGNFAPFPPPPVD